VILGLKWTILPVKQDFKSRNVIKAEMIIPFLKAFKDNKLQVFVVLSQLHLISLFFAVWASDVLQ